MMFSGAAWGLRQWTQLHYHVLFCSLFLYRLKRSYGFCIGIAGRPRPAKQSWWNHFHCHYGNCRFDCEFCPTNILSYFFDASSYCTNKISAIWHLGFPRYEVNLKNVLGWSEFEVYWWCIDSILLTNCLVEYVEMFLAHWQGICAFTACIAMDSAVNNFLFNQICV